MKSALPTFARAVALITVFAVATRAIGFVFRIFLSRVLGAEMLGVYQIAMAFFMVFLTLVSSGLPLAISKQVATRQNRGVVAAGLVIALCASALVCLVVLCGNRFFGVLFTDQRCVAILIALVPSVIAASVYSVIRAVWWGEKRFFLLGVTELLDQVLRVIVFVIMLACAFLFTDLSQIAALSYTVAFFIAAAVVVVIFVKTRRLKTPAPCPMGAQSQYRPLLRSAAPITGVRIVASLTMPVISILVPMRLIAAGWSPTAAVAGFGVLVGMTLPLLTIPQTVISSLSTALVPELSSAHKDKNQASVTRQIGNALRFTVFINFLLLPVFIALGEGIGVFLFADRTSGIFLSQYAWAMVPMSLSQITNAILNSLGAETRAMKNYFVGSIALFAAIWFLPGVMGIGALVIGMGACMAIASFLNLLLIAKLSGRRFAFSVVTQCVVLTLLTVPAALIGYFVQGLCAHVFSLFFVLAISGAVTLGAFVVLAHLFKVIDIKAVVVKRANAS